MLGALEIEHLERGGDHLLAVSDDSGAFSCWICRYGIEAARPMWRTHREALVGEWKRPFPMFAACALDKIPLPPLDPTWPEVARLAHRMIVEALRAR